MSLIRLLAFFLSLPSCVKQALVVLTDVKLCFIVTWFAFCLRLGEVVRLDHEIVWSTLVAVCLAVPIFLYFGLYQPISRFSGSALVKTVSTASTVYGLCFFLICSVLGLEGVPRTIGVIQPMLLFFGVVLSRGIAHFALDSSNQLTKKGSGKKNALIYGAGSGGRQLLGVLGFERKTKVLGFLDDDPQLIGQTVDMIRVYAPSYLDELISTRGVHQLYIAIPSLSKEDRSAILARLSDKPIEIKVLPTVSDLLDGCVTVDDLQELDIEDLLGRSSIEPYRELLRSKVSEKIVMITGAGGSIGSELSRQLIALGPREILLLDNNEYSLYAIHEELLSLAENSKTLSKVKIFPLLGSICDVERMSRIMCSWSINTIFHAAAYKHVPIVEHNPIEAIRNNVFGTLTLAEAAIEFSVSDFVLISTDKAVRPTNVMGATKRLAELVLQSIQASNESITRFSMVRFGNVLGSSGSVIPKFRRQIKTRSPLTVTHPEITRFFMTITEAAQLVIQASSLAKGGEVFVLDMGQPIKIVDLAKRMISLSGYTEKTTENPDGDVEIVFTGLRPGEKLYEELLIGDESLGTLHPKIMQAHEPCISWSDLVIQLDELNHAVAQYDAKACFNLLQNFGIEYKPEGKTADWNLEQVRFKARQS